MPPPPAPPRPRGEVPPGPALPLRSPALRDPSVRPPSLLASCPLRLPPMLPPPMLPAPHTPEVPVRSAGLALHAHVLGWRQLHARASGRRRLRARALGGGGGGFTHARALGVEAASRTRVGGGGGFAHAHWGGGGLAHARWGWRWLRARALGMEAASELSSGPSWVGTAGLPGPGSPSVTRAQPPPCRGPVRLEGDRTQGPRPGQLATEVAVATAAAIIFFRLHPKKQHGLVLWF